LPAAAGAAAQGSGGSAIHARVYSARMAARSATHGESTPAAAPRLERFGVRGPSHPPLGEGAVHVWLADLAGGVGASLAERAHGLLRELLGLYLERDPVALRFDYGEHGKPALREPDGVSFNLSHSGTLALYAFTPRGEVGVDVEVARRPLGGLTLAARAFGAGEAGRLAALEPTVREREFLRAWARHEAILKCRGTGIAAAAARGPGPEPWLAELDVGEHAAAAIAAEHAPRELCCWRWAP
jgi:hypothetical protein